MPTAGFVATLALITFNVALFGTFVGIFFFTFGSFVAKLVLRREITMILDAFVRDIKPFVPDDLWEEFRDFIRTLPKPDTSGDQATEDANRKLLTLSLVIFGGTLLGAAIILACAWYYVTRSLGEPLDLVRLLGESAGMLFFVAVVEVLFYSLIVANYRVVDANFVKKILVDNARAFAVRRAHSS